MRRSTDDDTREVNNESDPLALYLKQISRYSLLTIAEEQDIGIRVEKLQSKLEER